MNDFLGGGQNNFGGGFGMGGGGGRSQYPGRPNPTYPGPGGMGPSNPGLGNAGDIPQPRLNFPPMMGQQGIPQQGMPFLQQQLMGGNQMAPPPMGNQFDKFPGMPPMNNPIGPSMPMGGMQGPMGPLTDINTGQQTQPGAGPGFASQIQNPGRIRY